MVHRPPIWIWVKYCTCPFNRIEPCMLLSSAVCDIRLDFEQFTTNAPSLTTEASGGLCQDILTITTNTGQSIPEICGTNSGQHGTKSKGIIRIYSWNYFFHSLLGCGKTSIWFCYSGLYIFWNVKSILGHQSDTNSMQC